MRLTIDFTSAIGDRTGVGRYTHELVRALLRGNSARIRLAIHAFRHPGWHAKVRSLLGGVPGPFEVRASRLWPHGIVLELDLRCGLPPGEWLFGACDVFHGTNFLAPRFRSARTIVTVHDLAFLRHREEVPVAHRYERYLARSLRRATRVIAVSQATRRDLIELLEVPAGTIDVVPEGAPEECPTLSGVEFHALRKRHRIPERYLLFVGTLEPRKNLVRLLRAAMRIPSPPAVVLAGREGWHSGPIHEAIAAARRTLPVITPGFVTEAEKHSLYRHAIAFAYPSLYEGFGLPVLEAFAAGTPVLTANTSALPEVAGDAALLVDPRDTEAIAAGLRRLTVDEELRKGLVAAGQQRIKRFSWDRTARESRLVYERALR